jgi:hypothetical protein
VAASEDNRLRPVDCDANTEFLHRQVVDVAV